MSDSQLIEEVLLHLLGNGAKSLHEVNVIWEDEHVLSLRWRGRTRAGSAKVLKSGIKWSLLHHEEHTL